jgi:hypothetical protein
MFHSPKNFASCVASVLTAGAGEKKQQRVTLHCGKEFGVAGQKIMPPSGWKAASISRVDPASSLIPNRRNGFWTKCAAAASRR